VSVQYELKLPNLLYNIPGFPKPFIVSARSECYNDSWYLGLPTDISKS